MNTVVGVHETGIGDADLAGSTAAGHAHEMEKPSCGILTGLFHTKAVKGFTTQPVCQSENFCQVKTEAILN